MSGNLATDDWCREVLKCVGRAKNGRFRSYKPHYLEKPHSEESLQKTVKYSSVVRLWNEGIQSSIYTGAGDTVRQAWLHSAPHVLGGMGTRIRSPSMVAYWRTLNHSGRDPRPPSYYELESVVW